jgi:hypothetical protein
MLDVVRREIQRQVKSLGIATKDDLARLEARLASRTSGSKKVVRSTATTAKKPPKATAKAGAKTARKAKKAKKAKKAGATRAAKGSAS